MADRTAFMIPEVSHAIMSYLLPSLLILTFELALPEIGHSTEQDYSARVTDRYHAVNLTARILRDRLRPLPVLFCRMIRPHILTNRGPDCYTVHILQIDALRCRRIGAASKAWMRMVSLFIAGTGRVCPFSFPMLALDHNVSCTMHFDEDHIDVKTDVSIADLMRVQKFKCPMSFQRSTAD